MRLLISICFFWFGLGFSAFSMAQDQAASETAKSQPTEKTTKPKAPSEKADTDVVEDEFDIDEFFKQGEENAKEGSSCQSPPEPIS